MWSKLHASIFYVSKCSILNKIKVNVKQHIREEIFFTKKKKKSEEIYIQNVLRFLMKMLCLNHFARNSNVIIHKFPSKMVSWPNTCAISNLLLVSLDWCRIRTKWR